jgi:hypothetical protein
MAESAAFKPAPASSDHIAVAPLADEPPASAQTSRPRPAGGPLRPSQVPVPGETTRRTGSPSPAGGRAHHQLQRLRPSDAPTGAALPLARPSTVPARPIQDVLRGLGQPLAAPLKEEMEARLGADFSDVRVHTDGAARASAAEVGARAYTCGSHVVIGDGGADKHTLAHELTHVIQQRQGPVAGTDHGNGLKVSHPSDHDEKAAEANAARVMRAPLGEHRVAALSAAPLAAPAVLQRAINPNQAAVMPGPYPAGTGGGIHADAVTAINSLDYGMLWGGAGTLTNTTRARLDMQGYTAAGQMNLQVQVNGVAAPSTIATVLVSPTVAAVLPPSPRSVPQQTEITRKVKAALFSSLNDFEQGAPHIWAVTGTPSS